MWSPLAEVCLFCSGVSSGRPWWRGDMDASTAASSGGGRGVLVGDWLYPLAGLGGEGRTEFIVVRFAAASVPLDLLQADLLRLSPPTRGRCGEFDGGPVCFDGAGEEPSAARYCCYSCLLAPPSGAVVVKDGGIDWASSSNKQQWSWKAIFWSITSAAGDSRPTSKARQWPIQKPAKGSVVCLTSFVRPLLRSAAAYYVCTKASGSVPAFGHDGGDANLRLGSGEREGPDAVFSANTRDQYVISYFMGSFVKLCTSTVWI